MSSIKKNFLYNVFYQILVIILPLITAPYISRKLGPTGVGVYSYTNSVINYFLLFAMLGISIYGNREIASVRDDKDKISKYFMSIYSIQLMTFSIAIIVYSLYILVFVREYKLVSSIQVIYLIAGMLDISWLYFGLEKFKLTVTRNVIIKVITVISIFIFVHNENDLLIYTLIMTIGTFFSQVYLWLYLKEYVSQSKILCNDIKKHIKPIMILFIPVVGYSIYKVMDKIMLGNMTTYEQVGFFQNAEKIINIPMGIITALGVVMLPRMSNMYSNGEADRSKNYINLSIKFVSIIGSAIAFGLFGISDVFVPVFFGDGYEECILLIKLLSITVLFIAWANVIRTQYLIPTHKDKIYVLSTMIGAIMNLLMNVLLIPRFYGNGAAIGTIIAEFTVMFIQVFAIKKELKSYIYILKSIPHICIGIIMALCIRKIGMNLEVSILTLVIQIGVGAIIYVILTTLYMCLIKDEFYITIKSMFK